MRSRNELERLAAAAPAVQPAIDTDEEDRILERILAADRGTRHRKPRVVLLLAGVAVVAAAAVVATGLLDRTSSPAAKSGGRQHVALTGPTIDLAGYRFRTPTNFKASNSPCAPAPAAGQPPAGLSQFAVAASAAGGCVEATLLVPHSPSASALVATPAGEPLGVGAYQGYIDSGGSSGESTLYVELPAAQGPPRYLVLFAWGLTQDQLIAVAESGLPASP